MQTIDFIGIEEKDEKMLEEAQNIAKEFCSLIMNQIITWGNITFTEEISSQFHDREDFRTWVKMWVSYFMTDMYAVSVDQVLDGPFPNFIRITSTYLF